MFKAHWQSTRTLKRIAQNRQRTHSDNSSSPWPKSATPGLWKYPQLSFSYPHVLCKTLWFTWSLRAQSRKHSWRSEGMHILCKYTSGTAQGAGGSFKNRKPIGEVSCCESRMAERTDWWTERWLECRSIYLSIYPSIFLSIHLSIYLSINLSIYLSIYLSIHQSFYLSIHPSVCLSAHLSIYFLIY